MELHSARLNQRSRRLSGPVGESLGLGVDSQARPHARHRIRNFGRVARVIKARCERPPPKACARSRELLLGRRANWLGRLRSCAPIAIQIPSPRESSEEGGRSPSRDHSQTPVDGLADATYRKCALMAAAPLAIAFGCLAGASRSAIAIGSRSPQSLS